MRPSLLCAVFLSFPLFVPTAIQAQDLSLPDWSGAYLGAGLGASVGLARTGGEGYDNAQPAYFDATDIAQLRTALQSQHSATRLAGYVLVGYGQQEGALYYGLEGSLGATAMEGSRTVSQSYNTVPAASFTNTLSYAAHWQAAVRARLGFAQDNWLAYVSAGLAATQVHLDASFSDNNITGASGSSRSDPLALGVTLGLGAEYALNEHWALRTDYAYTHFGEASTTMSIAYPGFGSDLRNSVALSSHTVTVGLSYRF